MKPQNNMSRPSETSALVLPIAYPLDDFYARAGKPLPAIRQVRAEDIPEPYRQLLVHRDDMTPTLERFHGDVLRLRVLRSDTREIYYFREVVLSLARTGAPVEFGAIKINLSLYPPAARKLILEEREPLGRILQSCGVTHTSKPKAFFSVQSDSLIGEALGLTAPAALYGRRNTLSDPQHRPLAEIVEIIPLITLKSL